MSYMTPKPASYDRRDSIFSSVSNSSGLSGSDAVWSSSPSTPGQESSHERNHAIPHAYEGPVTPPSGYHHDHRPYLHRSLIAPNTYDWPNSQADDRRMGNLSLNNSCSTTGWDTIAERNWSGGQPIRHGLSLHSYISSPPSTPLVPSFGPMSEQHCFPGNQQSPVNASRILEQMHHMPELTSSPLFSDLATTSFNTAATWGTVSPASTITGSDSSFMTDTTTFRQELVNSFDAFGIDEDVRDDAQYYKAPSDSNDNFVMITRVPQTPPTSPARRRRGARRGRVASTKRRGPTKKAIQEKIEKWVPHLTGLEKAIEITSDESSDKKHCPHIDREGIACSRAFKRQEHLTRHMKTHTQDKEFVCAVGWKHKDVCNKSFGRHDNRLQHYVTHITRKRNKYQDRWMVYDAIREYAPYDRHTCKPEKQISSIEHYLGNPNLTIGPEKSSKPKKVTGILCKF